MKEIYLQLLSEGHTLNAIDEMDFFYFLDLLAYKTRKEHHDRRITIDQIF